MERSRIIPSILILNDGLVKTINFKKPRYIGDPINTVRLFNDKEVDEIIVLDIGVSKNNMKPQFKLIERLASECFMPLAYGGGVSSFEDAKKLFDIGVEKISLNTSLIKNIELIGEIVDVYGSQAVIGSVDIKKNIFGKYKVCNGAKKKPIKENYINFCKKIEKLGVGEILINDINNDGKMCGYDITLYKSIVDSVNVPVVALGGAGSLSDIKNVIVDSKVSAASAGSLFIYEGLHNAVLINYPSQQELKDLFKED